MSSKTSYLLFAVLLLVGGCAEVNDAELSEQTNPAALAESESHLGLGKLLDAETLDSLLAKTVKVVPVYLSKKKDTAMPLIPGSVWFSRNDLRSTAYPYSGMMLEKEALAALLGKAGISANDLLVLYDSRCSAEACRLWWMLHCYGFENVKILNGGRKAWQDARLPMGLQAAKRPPAHFEFPAQKFRLFADKTAMNQALHDTNCIVLDTRTINEYMGTTQKKGAAKAGRIPGSICIDWAEAVNYTTDKKFKHTDELKHLYQPVMGENKEVFVYCHSGVRSAHTTFVLTQLLGCQKVVNYDGSWVEWSHSEELTTEKFLPEKIQWNGRYALSGKIKLRAYELPAGERFETFILVLDNAISVGGNDAFQGRVEVAGQNEVHLNGSNAAIEPYVGRKVLVQGPIFHGQTVHHLRDVCMHVHHVEIVN